MKRATVVNRYQRKLDPSRGHVSGENPRGRVSVAEEIGFVVARLPRENEEAKEVLVSSKTAWIGAAGNVCTPIRFI